MGARSARSCIFIRLDGGCSHVDTFDVKPGVTPFRAIRTSVPGIQICEHLPRTARLAHRYTIIRSMCAAETNHERAALAIRPSEPALIAASGLADSRYGATPMGREFLRACRMVERGARIAVASGGRLRWDTHNANFARLRDELLPEFDLAFSALIEDLDASGLLATTLVVVTGEFGRTPRVNTSGGRDHHAAAWSALIAGAGVPGGRVIGATDRNGFEVADAPVSPSRLIAAINATLDGRPAEALA